MFRHQDETAKGVWGSDAQHRHDHHQTTVVPQLGPQDSHAVSSYVCVCDTCAAICFIKCLEPPLLSSYTFRGHYASGNQSPADNSQKLKSVSSFKINLLIFEDNAPRLLSGSGSERLDKVGAINSA